ncbi:hypothetical protein EKO04_003023 [Ascochyta lentis]|uniref:Uncharacterized protein n=1 Tax=Ascochyta lentis TaxID=205686 RepID=A0A8H7J6B2_9PLEO|nr:hypothetical protein EKO04_003023 [Ascochyta lentis]
MTYMVGELIKEIEAGGPVPSFPKQFQGPPKLEKEREAVDLDIETSQAPRDTYQTEMQEPQEDWVRKKWAWYYEPNKDGIVKPQLGKMNIHQFEEYMKDVLAQSRDKAGAASRRLEVPERSAEEQQTHPVKPRAEPGTEPAAPLRRSLVTPAAGLETVGAEIKDAPRKKPRVKAYITKEQYLKK